MNLITEKVSKILIWTGLIIVGFSVIIFLYKESIFNFESTIQADKVGQFGDFVGGIAGALWALAGVILFYVALDKQKESLILQIKEFELQRQELVATRKVFTEQNRTQLVTQYETSFYNLLDLLQKIVSDFKFKRIESKIAKEGQKPQSFTDTSWTSDEYQHIPILI